MIDYINKFNYNTVIIVYYFQFLDNVRLLFNWRKLAHNDIYDLSTVYKLCIFLNIHMIIY